MSVMHAVLAHAHGAAHVHPHGVDVAGVLAIGAILLLLGLAVRARRPGPDGP